MRWFAEAVWYPTALLLSQGVTWSAVDETSARATWTDGRLVLSLLFRFGPDGLVSSIHVDTCAATVKGVSLLLSWECRLSYDPSQGGMLVPMTGKVLYFTADGEQSYFRGTVMRIGYRFHLQRA